MSSTEIYTTQTETVQGVFADDDMQLTPDLSAEDVICWDSFKQIKIIMATEARFGIRMITRDIDSLSCFGDLVAQITERRS